MYMWPVLLVGLVGFSLFSPGGGNDILKAAEKVGKVLTVVDQLKKQLYSVTGSKGQVIVQGRTLHYEVKAGFYKWKYEYKGKAWDEEAGISIKTKAYESEQGAREHALEDLAAELKKLGLLVD